MPLLNRPEWLRCGNCAFYTKAEGAINEDSGAPAFYCAATNVRPDVMSPDEFCREFSHPELVHFTSLEEVRQIQTMGRFAIEGAAPRGPGRRGN